MHNLNYSEFDNLIHSQVQRFLVGFRYIYLPKCVIEDSDFSDKLVGFGHLRLNPTYDHT